MKPVTVHTTAPATSTRATAHWDEESSTVSCEVHYSPAHPPQSRLSDKLDAQLGIAAPSYVLTAGTLSMLLDRERRLIGLDFYTNPEQWIACGTRLADPTTVTPHIDAEFDAHGHAADLDAPQVFYEPSGGTLYFSWGPASAWYGIASTLAVGVAEDKRLAQIRVDGLTMPARR
ncbi:hypothetical protein LJ656_04645 [Paraburkholderia sp. MMS20-SJTR3]|uniref:Uncharacterized protein n=1 Tax=Paraburkholderia sejongensis TaxID=2886946 RepID=A0ABS8JQ38_9BURK|nr:hypothetical protein [Paraburkholderia sp. MMS20-SJTR3]MCC8391869.1 hypothetical protein [Paraburkholderia sp. MMS20-SJTR3]